MCGVRVGWVRTLGGMWVGGPVRVAGGERVVADVRRHHEPLHDHDVHRDEVVLDGWDALGPLWGAPVLLQEESSLSLRFEVGIKTSSLVLGGESETAPGRWGLPCKPQSTPCLRCTPHR